MSIWFSYVGVTVGEMFDARLPLMIEAMCSAAERRPMEAIEALNARMREMADNGDLGEDSILVLDRGFAALSDNPALILLADAMSGLLGSRLRGTRARLEPALTDDDARLHLLGYERLADSLAHGEVGAATRRIERLLGSVRERLKDRPARARRLPARIDAVFVASGEHPLHRRGGARVPHEHACCDRDAQPARRLATALTGGRSRMTVAT